MNVVLLITTLFITPAGNVAPDVEAVLVKDMAECSILMSKIRREAQVEGQKVFTYCQSARTLEYYLKHDYKGRPYL